MRETNGDTMMSICGLISSLLLKILGECNKIDLGIVSSKVRATRRSRLRRGKTLTSSPSWG